MTAKLIRLYYGCNTPSAYLDIRNALAIDGQDLSYNRTVKVPCVSVEVMPLGLRVLIGGRNNLSATNPWKPMVYM